MDVVGADFVVGLVIFLIGGWAGSNGVHAKATGLAIVARRLDSVHEHAFVCLALNGGHDSAAIGWEGWFFHSCVVGMVIVVSICVESRING